MNIQIAIPINKIMINQRFYEFTQSDLDITIHKNQLCSYFNYELDFSRFFKIDEIHEAYERDQQLTQIHKLLFLQNQADQLKFQSELADIEQFIQPNSVFIKQIGKQSKGQALVIGLHGGGGCESEINDAAFQKMQWYYCKALEEYNQLNQQFNFLYLALRGLSNTWDMHCQDQSEDILRKLILFCSTKFDCSQNRVILTGFSAGGDGAHFLGSYIPDLFCFVNASAGHHNWCSQLQRHSVMSMYQVGELDHLYSRQQVTVQRACEADFLRSIFGGFRSQTAVHAAIGHNFNDFELESSIFSEVKLQNGQLTGKNIYKLCCQPVIYGLCQQRKVEPELVIIDCSTKFNKNQLDFVIQYNCVVSTEDVGLILVIKKIDDDIFKVDSVGQNFCLAIMVKQQFDAVQIIMNGKSKFLECQQNTYRERVLKKKMDHNFDFEFMVEIKSE
uniref:Uncharacterized protein n=1 Tax=Trepomonas sp. PC1 TaxID=1076344 RepID=A0A146KCW0_9EUKA|eukprot:JAP93754.1 Hypothetical protein TPC1_13841 [Trepomonas sp. PC1]